MLAAWACRNGERTSRGALWRSRKLRTKPNFMMTCLERKYQKLLTLWRALEAIWEMTRYERTQNWQTLVVGC